jgi:sorting nexin-9/18/33
MIAMQEWKRLVPQHLAMPAAGPAFYARVFHPDFNVDAEDAEEAVDRFDTHTRAIGKGVQGLRNIFGRVRDARVGTP